MAKSRILAAATHITRRAARRRYSVVSTILVVFLLLPIFLYFLLGKVIANDPRLVPHAIRHAQNVLLITAHPDDGALYFGPSMLQGWGRKHVNLYMLVLSSSGGKSDGRAETRRAETKASCAELGVVDKKCLILENKGLQGDSPKPWDEQIVERVLERHVKKWDIDLIITFDEYGGVSGAGANHDQQHRSVNKGVQRFIKNKHRQVGKDEEHKPTAYALQTTFVLRKYLSLADLVPTSFPFTLRILEALLTSVHETPAEPTSGGKLAPPKNGDVYGDRALIVTDWGRHTRAQAALGEHASRYTWDRVLYSVLSRYMWFNDLRRM
ncbi:hypothetical protein UA08_01418 [Talaromyces atroroseus]|uniref:N-acetylglucosaminylphosphatidylinositol deacetylase n=1 Tax=Talaromyces atroroseus TaxID=1441469 RepID=A0A1Q5QBB1_TALAT|nr:hypothetical protein UA08_01418 [Talaromyces atroroseus]OKL63206.1 hypothetical protein UA08_01418 [Talaromyces atroroseus]